jgi:hypothetical protein
MNLSDKIEEIRNKPEHVRIRYVWISVLIVMVFILIIWIFSLKETFKSAGTAKDASPGTQNYLDRSKENLPSLQELSNNSEKKLESEIGPQESQPVPDRGN